jgi:hypothetical protein
MQAWDPEKYLAIEYRYPVPPCNEVHVVIAAMSVGNFYVSIEDYEGDGSWAHRQGSANSVGTMADALSKAAELWMTEQEFRGGAAWHGSPGPRRLHGTVVLLVDMAEKTKDGGST